MAEYSNKEPRAADIYAADRRNAQPPSTGPSKPCRRMRGGVGASAGDAQALRGLFGHREGAGNAAGHRGRSQQRRRQRCARNRRKPAAMGRFRIRSCMSTIADRRWKARWSEHSCLPPDVTYRYDASGNRVAKIVHHGRDDGENA